MTPGRFSVVQLANDLNVFFISSSPVKAAVKNSPMIINFKDADLKQFQELAFTTAFTYVAGL